MRRSNFGAAPAPPEMPACIVLLDTNKLLCREMDGFPERLKALVNEYGVEDIKALARLLHRDDPSRWRRLTEDDIEEFADICERNRARKQRKLLADCMAANSQLVATRVQRLRAA